MPYQTQWLLPGRIIYSHTIGVVVADEVRAMIKEVADLGRSRDEAMQQLFVHQIVDATIVEKNTLSLPELKEIFGGNPPNPDLKLGWTYSITPAPLMRFFASLAMQWMGIRTIQVATVEEALKQLNERDDTLPDLDTLTQHWQQIKPY